MEAVDDPGPVAVTVRARVLSGSGRELADTVVPHGADPVLALLAAGARALRPVDAVLDGSVVRIDYRGEPASVVPMLHAQPRVDPSLVRVDGEVAVPFQRVSAYALVESSLGMLLTIATTRAHAGVWALPGGGLEGSEEPRHACAREVWEETGQRVEVGALVQVQSDHWVGRAPSGRLEDFHALRLVYRAVCPKPSEAQVQEVGGTTVRAAWLPPAELGTADLSRPVRQALGRR